ncbi:glycosyltransferase family 4 protein [Paracoccus sp. MC1862]|nr:glycosyltransferase family 4 protein [Paracoccus sp. MC1862]QQO46743.1 glycosyltransferase family 4 protein [Paracoccus sp. MC1862]
MTLVTVTRGHDLVLIWSGLIVFLIGAWEDLSGSVSARRRLIASMVAAMAAIVLSETTITRLDIRNLDLILSAAPLASLLLTILLSAAYTHAFNLIDGMNGLSSAAGISTAFALALAADVHDQAAIKSTSLLLAATISGFSIMNWPKGKLFLGDGGAYFVGHTLFWIAVMLAAAVPTLNIASIILILFWPIAELSTTVIRRLILKSPLSKPDRLHIHQIVRRGIEIATIGRKARPLANAMTTLCLLPLVIVPPLLGTKLTNDRSTALVSLALCFAIYATSYITLVRLASSYKARRAVSKLVPPPFRRAFRGLRFQTRRS